MKFYSSNDLNCGHNLKKSEHIIEQFSAEKKDYSINEIIELYNIKRLFNADIRLKEWDDLRYKELSDTVKNFDEPIGIFFSKIDNKNIKRFYRQIDNDYEEDFWKLFDAFKLYNRIDCKIIDSMLKKQELSFEYLLPYKKVSQKYGEEIRSYMIDNPQTAEILMTHYLTETDNKYFFPDILTPYEREKIIIDYIDSEFCGFNFLKLMINSNPSKELPFSDRTKLKAKKKHEQITKEFFERSPGYDYGVCVTFSSDCQEKFREEKDKRVFHFFL